MIGLQAGGKNLGGYIMKMTHVAIAIFAVAGLALCGCADGPASSVAPANQPAHGPAPLEKAVLTGFTFSHQPVKIIDPGTVKLVGGNWVMKDIGVEEEVISSDPLVAGTMVHYLSGMMDAVTGEGPVHGKLTLTPSAGVGGGVWEGTYEGYRSKADGIYYSLPLKVVLHGRGGTIDGMQVFEESLITAWGTPPEGWYGTGSGFYKSH